MNKKQFIDNFVVTFLASYVSSNYQYACSHDKHEMLNTPPVEDAYFLAEKAWKHHQDVAPSSRIYKKLKKDPRWRPRKKKK